MSVIADPIPFNNEVVSIKPKHDVRRDAPRYVICMGDFIQPSDKVALRDLGVRSGGLRIGPSETEGCPTMKRTNYIIRRACFTPLELTAIVPKMDEVDRDAKKNQMLVAGKASDADRSKNIFPGDDIQTLMDDSFRAQGVVELSKLVDVQWGEGIAQNLNKFFFPEIPEWLDGTKEFPTLLSAYEDMARSANVYGNEIQQVTQGQILESARIFRVYAKSQIEANRSRIMSTREIDMGGFSYKWEERTRLFAAQLGERLEAEDTIRPKEEDNPSQDRTAAAMETANELKAQELEIMRDQLRLARGAEVEAPKPVEVIEPVQEAVTPQLADTDKVTESKPSFPIGVLVTTLDGSKTGIVSAKPFGRYKVKLSDTGSEEMFDANELTGVGQQEAENAGD